MLLVGTPIRTFFRESILQLRMMAAQRLRRIRLANNTRLMPLLTTGPGKAALSRFMGIACPIYFCVEGRIFYTQHVNRKGFPNAGSVDGKAKIEPVANRGCVGRNAFFFPVDGIERRWVCECEGNRKGVPNFSPLLSANERRKPGCCCGKFCFLGTRAFTLSFLLLS